MTVWPIAALAAVVTIELCLRVLRSGWIAGEIAKQLDSFRQFQQAHGDSEKQRLLIHSGCRTLRFSLSLGVFLGLLAGIVFFFPWALAWDSSLESDYLLATTACGTVWGLVRVGVRPG